MELPTFRSGFVFGYLNLALVFAVVLSGLSIAFSWIMYRPRFGTIVLLFSLLPLAVGFAREYQRRARAKHYRYH